MAFRLTLPLLARLFNAGPKGIDIMLFVFNIAFLALLMKVLYEHSGSKVVASMTTLALANVYVGCAGFIDAVAKAVMAGYAFFI